MNQLTTIASLPSGGGQAQALKAETTPAPNLDVTGKLAALGYAVEAGGLIVHISKG